MEAPGGRRATALPDGVIVALVYLCAQGLMFLDKGLYWDDWTWYRQPWGMLADSSRQLGSMWPAWTLAAPYQSTTSVWVARAVAATCYLLASLWFLGILRRLGIDRTTGLVMALCFAAFPVNGARIPIATAAYGVSLALFVGGFRLVVASLDRPSPWVRSGAAAALLLSLRTASFGVLLPVVFGYVIWREGAARDVRRWPAIAFHHAELVLIPVAYVLLRLFVFIPSRTYGTYNTMTLVTVRSGIADVPSALWRSLVDPTVRGVGQLAGVVGFGAALAVLALMFLGRRAGDEAMSRRTAAKYVIVGLALVVVALLPYLLVGKMPSLDDFSSRHQLLVPFGAALAFGGALRFVFGREKRGTVAMIVVAALLLGGFVAADISNNVSYLTERYKNLAMMEAMQTLPEFRSATTFTFIDRTPNLSADRRARVRVTEYAGMMTEAFGDQTRFGAQADEFARLGMRGYRALFTAHYKMGEYVERPVQYQVEVLPGPLGINRASVLLRLLETDLFRPFELPSAVTGAIVLRPRAVGMGN